MTPLALPGWVQAAFCCYESYRRFGHRPDDIFFHLIEEGVDRKKVKGVVVALQTPMDELPLFAYRSDGEVIDVAIFQEAIRMWNEAHSNEEWVKEWALIYDSGLFDKARFAVAMQQKGLINLHRAVS